MSLRASQRPKIKELVSRDLKVDVGTLERMIFLYEHIIELSGTDVEWNDGKISRESYLKILMWELCVLGARLAAEPWQPNGFLRFRTIEDAANA